MIKRHARKKIYVLDSKDGKIKSMIVCPSCNNPLEVARLTNRDNKEYEYCSRHDVFA